MSAQVIDFQQRQDEKAGCFLSRAQLAEHLQLSTRTIDRLVGDGMPSETFGIRTRRFRLADVESWLRRRSA